MECSAKGRSACAAGSNREHAAISAEIARSTRPDSLDVQAALGEEASAPPIEKNSEQSRQESTSLADGEFASPVQDQHSTGSPVSCSQEPSGEEADDDDGDEKSNQMYINQNKTSGKERRKLQWRKTNLQGKRTRRSTSPVSKLQWKPIRRRRSTSPTKATSGEDQLMATGRLDAQAVQESSAAPVGKKKVKLHRDAFNREETKTDQQQDEPESLTAHDGTRSSEKEAAASSLLVMDTQGTCKADMRAGAGDNAQHTDKVASVANDEESVNWDAYELRNFVNSHIDKLPTTPPYESWAEIEELEEPEITKLMERLALCRIRAHQLLKKGQQARDVEDLKTEYSSTALEDNGYFARYERSFEWYFDTEFCDIGGLQDYQRLVLRNTYAYLKPSEYRQINDTYEVDQEFVKFYEKIEMETKGIVTALEDGKLQWKGFEALTFVRALKIALGFRLIYKDLFFSAVQEFLWSIEFDCNCHDECARLYFEVWKRATKQEMDFYCALRQIHEKNICPMFNLLMEPELKYEENPNHSPKPCSIKHTYDTFMAEIPADATEHLAQQLIKDAVKKIVPKKKTYYDYIKKKLEVAEKIQLIPCEIQL